MRKILIIFSLFAVFLTAGESYAQYGDGYGGRYEGNPNPYIGWIMGGYGYSQSVDNSWKSTGPVKLTIGGNLWKFIAMELSSDFSWKEWHDWGKNLAWKLDLKPYVLIQHSIGNRANAIMPYVGIAPVLSISGLSYENYDRNDSSFDVGVATKGGVRLRLFNSFMMGVGIEYVYTVNNLHTFRDMSQFIASIEAGFTW